jgi:hypothetical protein
LSGGRAIDAFTPTTTITPMTTMATRRFTKRKPANQTLLDARRIPTRTTPLKPTFDVVANRIACRICGSHELRWPIVKPTERARVECAGCRKHYAIAPPGESPTDQ